MSDDHGSQTRTTARATASATAAPFALSTPARSSRRRDCPSRSHSTMGTIPTSAPRNAAVYAMSVTAASTRAIEPSGWLAMKGSAPRTPRAWRAGAHHDPAIGGRRDDRVMAGHHDLTIGVEEEPGPGDRRHHEPHGGQPQ